jgi:glucose/arabinose dehydrogenase
MNRISLCLRSTAVCCLLALSTMAQGVPSPYTMRLQPFLTGLSRPILLRSAKDGSKRLFVVQQAGVIKVLQPGSTTPTNFIDLSSKIVIPATTGDERGLLGLTFHPQFMSNGKFYVDYTRVADGATVIAEYKTVGGTGASNSGDITSERIMLTIPQPFSNHNGGMVEFGPDGYLYIGMGDGGSANDPGNRAQNPAQLLGKLLRIDPNIPVGSPVPYLIPPTNPFTGANTTRCDGGSTTAGNTCQELWTIGMRNPWRYSFDRGGTNQLWVADVGQGSREEVDVISGGGGNYGWRVYEGTSCTGNDPGLCTPANYIMPLFDYLHSGGRCSITGGYVYRGTQGSLPVGAYTYGDYCTGEVLIWNNNAPTVLQVTGRSIVSFGEDEDGEIYICYNNGQVDKISRAKASADVDGDLKTDFTVYRPSEGEWYANNSSNGTVRAQQFGIATDIPAPEDYDGDNITDIGVFRPTDGYWYYFRSSTNTLGAMPFGANGDIPAAGDYDGDAKADFTVYRPSSGVWFTYRSSDGGFAATQFGTAEDIPVAGDYDGDGKYDIAVFRPSNGVWYKLNSLNGAFSAVQFGTNGDTPTPGDFDGDGRLDTAVFRPSNGFWYVMRSSNNGFQATQWGLSTDIPVVGDYDGDGKEDVAVFRPATGVWYVLRSTNSSLLAAQFGANGDAPAPRYDRP